MIFLSIYKVLRGVLEGRKKNPSPAGKVPLSFVMQGWLYFLSSFFSELFEKLRQPMGVPSHAQRRPRRIKSIPTINSRQYKITNNVFFISIINLVVNNCLLYSIYKAFLVVSDGIKKKNQRELPGIPLPNNYEGRFKPSQSILKNYINGAQQLSSSLSINVFYKNFRGLELLFVFFQETTTQEFSPFPQLQYSEF